MKKEKTIMVVTGNPPFIKFNPSKKFIYVKPDKKLNNGK